MTPKFFAMLGAASAFLAIFLGAFGAHALKQSRLKEMLDIFEIGVRYQFYHAFAFFAIAWAISYFSQPIIPLSGLLLLVGTFIFSGSLYLLTFTGIRWWGAITPIGGLILLLGWAMLLFGIWKSSSP